MNEQHTYFVGEMRAFGLLSEASLSLPSLDLRLASIMIMSLRFP